MSLSFLFCKLRYFQLFYRVFVKIKWDYACKKGFRYNHCIAVSYDHEHAKWLAILLYTLSIAQRSTSKSGSMRETLEIHRPDFFSLVFSTPASSRWIYTQKHNLLGFLLPSAWSLLLFQMEFLVSLTLEISEMRSVRLYLWPYVYTLWEWNCS